MRSSNRNSSTRPLAHSSTQRIWLFLLPIVLVGCASGRQEIYQDLMTEFREGAQPEYYRTEVAKAVPKPNSEPKDDFLFSVETKVLKSKWYENLRKTGCIAW